MTSPDAYVRRAALQLFGEGSPYVDFWPVATSGPLADPRATLVERMERLARLISALQRAASDEPDRAAVTGGQVFIGHGRSPVWRELRDFLEERLNLSCIEFNSQSVAGHATTARLSQMLDSSAFAFLVMTAEDEHADATMHARENVVHEIGLFQGRLGMERAIVLREDGCQLFSNIHGLTYIGFPTGRIRASFEDIREVLEREAVAPST